MPNKSEIEIRIEELIEEVINNSNNTTEIDGETLKQINNEINELKQKITQLERESKNKLSLEDLEKILEKKFGEHNFGKDGKYIGGAATTQPSSPSRPIDTPSEEVKWNGFFSSRKDIAITDQETWKKSGLSIKDAEKVYKMGWKDQIGSIKNGKLDYGDDKDLDVRFINKKYLETVNSLLKEINDPSRKTFKSLPENFKEQEIKNLSNFDDQLPLEKKSTDLKQAIINKRSTFVYYLNEPNNEVDGDGLTRDELNKALALTKEEWKAKTYGKVTNWLLEELLEEELETVPEELRDEEPVDLTQWLIGQGGYEINKETTPLEIRPGLNNSQFITGKEVWEKEEEWIKNDEKEKQGTLLLPYLFAKFKFNPDKLREGDEYGKGKYLDSVFCKMATGQKQKPIDAISKFQGRLPLPTSSGKTTKLVNCLIRGGLENVILVVPNFGLRRDAYYHHTTWLRKNEKGEPYKCVYHGVAHSDVEGYPVIENDLCYYLKGNENNDPGGKKGLSILEDWCLAVLVVRDLVKNRFTRWKKNERGDKWTTEKGSDKFDLCEPRPGEESRYGKLNEDYENKVKKIKDKLIYKDDTIIIFDEAHFAKNPNYHILQKGVVKLGYKVLLMSATFKGTKDQKIPFSITSSYPRTILKQSKIDIPSEKLANSKVLIFLKKAELSQRQKELLDDTRNGGKNPISYCVFDKTALSASTGITKGMQKGSIFIADTDMEMGYTPFVDIVILTNRMQTTSLGVYKEENKKKLLKERWVYGSPEVRGLSTSSLVQEIGRVGRITSGLAIVLNNFKRENGVDVTEEFDTSSILDVSCKFLEAALSGDTKRIEGDYANLNNPNFIQAALALDYKFGLRVEEVLIGLGGFKPYYPTYENEPTRPFDDGLWNRHMGKEEEIKIDPARGKELLCSIIRTYLENEPNFPKIKIGFDSPLIKDAGLTIDKVRGVLNNFLKDKLGLKDYDRDKSQYTGAEKDTFEKVVKFYKIANEINVDLYWQYKDKEDHNKGYKDDLFLSIITVKQLSEEELKDFNKSFIPCEEGEKGPPKPSRRALGVSEVPQKSWTCKECRTISLEGATCRACGWWRHANSQRKENYSEVNQEAKIEVPLK